MNSFLFANPVLACFANDNDALIPELWAQEGLAILEENMVMARLVHRDFSDEVANYGDVVNTRRPGSFSTKRKTDTDSVTNQDAVATNVQVPLDQHVYVTFTIKDGEASKSFQDLVDMYLTPAAQQIARSVDRILIGQAPQFLANTVGRLNEMSSSNAKDFLLEAREKMNVNKAYPSGRNVILSPSAETELLKTELFISAEKRGDDGTALREASLGRLLGFDAYMDQNVSGLALTAVTANERGVNNASGYAAGYGPTADIAIDAGAGSGNLIVTVGEYLWIEGEGYPHEITAETNDGNTTNAVQLGDALQSAIVDDAVVQVFTSTTVSGNYAAGYAKEITLAAAYVATGQIVAFDTGSSRHVYTCVEGGGTTTILLDRPLDAALTNGDAAYPGPHGSFNLAFHRDALALVSRPLALPNTALGVRSSVGVYNDVAMRVSMQYDISSQGTIVTLDLLCGVAVLDENLGCVMLS